MSARNTDVGPDPRFAPTSVFSTYERQVPQPLECTVRFQEADRVVAGCSPASRGSNSAPPIMKIPRCGIQKSPSRV